MHCIPLICFKTNLKHRTTVCFEQHSSHDINKKNNRKNTANRLVTISRSVENRGGHTGKSGVVQNLRSQTTSTTCRLLLIFLVSCACAIHLAALSPAVLQQQHHQRSNSPLFGIDPQAFLASRMSSGGSSKAPSYGAADYWDNRYSEETVAFDWLFDYTELSHLIEQLLPVKDVPILMVGCGNALFSPEMHRIGGYTTLVNTDLSPVVISQMKERFPDMIWKEMDVLDMSADIDDGAYKVVVDKSLIDTLLCYPDSIDNTNAMINEIRRVLAPGGRYLTFSLHSPEEIKEHFACYSDWQVTLFRVKSNRWNDTNNRRRAVAHTMVVADLPFEDGSFPFGKHPLALEGVLTEEEYQVLQNKADEVNLNFALNKADVNMQIKLLDSALAQSQAQETSASKKKNKNKNNDAKGGKEQQE